MKDDDTDSGGDFVIDALKTLIVVGFVVLFVITAGAAIWEFVL